MKKIILAILIIVLVVLVGTWPLSILAKIFEWIAFALKWLAKTLNIFGWNGIL
jgi:lauroyl/myristoyl acyltransferase